MSQQSLPSSRGPSSDHLASRLLAKAGTLGSIPLPEDHPITGEDFCLTLYICYELHYRGFDGVEAGWEWEPSLLEYRRSLEDLFENALVKQVAPAIQISGLPIETALKEVTSRQISPSASRYLEHEATVDQFLEFVVHRSAYHLKEADPHSWAIPRLTGRAKAALVEIQADEYGGGAPERVHATLFARMMSQLGLDSSYGAYLDVIPGITLSTVNLMSLLGLHRRWRGGVVGHLAAFEMTSPLPNRRYGNGLRRLGFGPNATRFFDEHVEADSVHEVVAAHDLAGSLVAEEPQLYPDVLFGASAYMELDALWGAFMLNRWSSGDSSLMSSAHTLGLGTRRGAGSAESN
jgi:hypothetical protein